MQGTFGPVAVFGASNFPLAFSTAGGDTATALAAGCPVVVKGHSAHPDTLGLVAQAFDAAIKSRGVLRGVFSQIQGGNCAVGRAIVQHPLIRAVVIGGEAAMAFTATASEELSKVSAQTMLTAGISKAYHQGRDRIAGAKGVREVLTTIRDQRNATPYLFETTAVGWLADETLSEEVFGLFGLVVFAKNAEEVTAVAKS